MTDNITLPRATVEQVLEALKSAAIFVDSFRGQKATQDAITDLRAALAEPATLDEAMVGPRALVQEPFALPCPTPKACKAHCCSGHCVPRTNHPNDMTRIPPMLCIPHRIPDCPKCMSTHTTPPQRKPLTDGLEIKVKRELFRFQSEQEWVNKGKSWYANCGVRKGHYITVDSLGHVMHMGLCLRHATYPVTCYELQTNWPNQSAAHHIQEPKP